MSGVKFGGRESDLTIPETGVRFGHYDSTLTHRLLKVTFWRRARLSIGRKTLAPLLRSITTRPRSIVSEWCGVGRP